MYTVDRSQPDISPLASQYTSCSSSSAVNSSRSSSSSSSSAVAGSSSDSPCMAAPSSASLKSMARSFPFPLFRFDGLSFVRFEGGSSASSASSTSTASSFPFPLLSFFVTLARAVPLPLAETAAEGARAAEETERRRAAEDSSAPEGRFFEDDGGAAPEVDWRGAAEGVRAGCFEVDATGSEGCC
jgi:hypothetical protein